MLYFLKLNDNDVDKQSSGIGAFDDGIAITSPDAEGNITTMVKVGDDVAKSEEKRVTFKDKDYKVSIVKFTPSGGKSEVTTIKFKGKQALPDGFYLYDESKGELFDATDSAKTSSLTPTFKDYLTSAETYAPARDAVKRELEKFREFINTENQTITVAGQAASIPFAGTFFNKGGKWNIELNAMITMIENGVKIDFDKDLQARVNDLSPADKALHEPVLKGIKEKLSETLVAIMNDDAVRNVLVMMNIPEPAPASAVKNPFAPQPAPKKESYRRLREAPESPATTLTEEARKNTFEAGLFDKNLPDLSTFVGGREMAGQYVTTKSTATAAGRAGPEITFGQAEVTSSQGAGSSSGDAPAGSATNTDTARTQIVATLSKLLEQVDDPKDLSAPAKLALAASDFKKGGAFYNEIKSDIDKIKDNNLPITFGEKFKKRESQETRTFQLSNQTIAFEIEGRGFDQITAALAAPENGAALALLSSGAQGKLEDKSDGKKLYDATIGFAGLFDMDDKLVAFLKSAKADPQGNVTVAAPAPTTPGAAPTTPAGAPGDATARSAAPTGAVTTGAVDTSGGGSGSASSNGGAAQPGAAAEVTDIAVAAVRILNARPAPVQVFMDFGPPKSADIEQPVPLQWTIDPAYFSGYQLQINDSQRAIIAQYKNQQVILRVSATPLTGGRPVEVKQPLSIRTYRLPDQAELIPIKTFTFGRLAGTQSVSPEPAAQGGARDFSKRVAEVPCFFYKADGGVGAPAGDAVGVTSAASGRTYRFDFPEGFLVPIRIKFDEAKNPKTADKLVKLRKEQGLLSESKGKLLKEAGVPHWIFLKRRGALDSGRGGAGGGADAGADADAAGGLRVNIAVKTIVISTTDKLRVVGNSGNPWDASSFKAAFYPGKGAQFDKDEFLNAGLILCDDDFGLFSGLDRGAVMTAMYRVLFTDRAPDSSAYKLVGLQKWADDIRVIGSNPEVSATARRKPDNLFASA